MRSHMRMIVSLRLATAAAFSPRPRDGFWQIRGVDEQPALRSVARGANAYVAVGEDGQIFRSLSGVTWDHLNLRPRVQAPPTMRDVIWTGSLFLAVGDVGNIWTSTSGTNWEQRLSGVVSRLNAAASNGHNDHRRRRSGPDPSLLFWGE